MSRFMEPASPSKLSRLYKGPCQAGARYSAVGSSSHKNPPTRARETQPLPEDILRFEANQSNFFRLEA